MSGKIARMRDRIIKAWYRFTRSWYSHFSKLYRITTLRNIARTHSDGETRRIILEKTGVEIGKNATINSYSYIIDWGSKIKIGDRVAISPGVTLIASASPNNSLLKENVYVKARAIKKEPIIVEKDAWIGANATILPG